MKSRMLGFTLIFLIVAVVVVAIVLGVVGWRVYDVLISRSGGNQETTLTGFVTEGPISPVCRMGDSCTRPITNHTVEAVVQGGVVASASTDNSGYYRLSLKPGRYSLMLVPKVGTRITNSQVNVVAGANTFNISIDTGIR